ncbi:hypothetical protein GCM10022389_01890 [Flavobacterium cheonanense]|uniref:Uncharacterized protein n=1 Tax=Flavobacterium cheonanense TaxID=706183 RepID=A0ABP7V9E2_9FLAO
MNVLIKDEQLNGTVTNQFEIEIERLSITIQELIEKRVTHEIEIYNKKFPDYFNGLVKPSDAERTLNGFKLKPKQIIDVEKQIYVALDAFQKNGFFILVDNQQLEELSQIVNLNNQSIISFVKLTPLVGG